MSVGAWGPSRCRGGEGSYTDQVTDPGKDSVIGMGTKGCCFRKGLQCF